MRIALALLATIGCASADAEQKAETPYDKHVTALRARLAKLGLGAMKIRVEEPFVVVGESGLERNSGTVRWAADILERDFFDKRPAQIIDVYLFDTPETYERGVKKLTGDSPGTPYGFYSRTHRGLFMNISTGGGTLVHEIVHPYVEADFPNAPAWLNEGLGSLFEQSAELDGHIVGRTNWRLAGLQKAIAKNTVPSFATLTAMDNATFYGEASGTNYAQARYLLYYMQEQGKLRDFYKAFRAARTTDPSGYATLVKALGEKDMATFHKRWQTYVANLTFP